MDTEQDTKNFLDQPGLDLYDELIKDYIHERIEEVGDIVDIVPNEIIKMLWDGTVKFSDLISVSGEKDYTPVDRETNYFHFLQIFYPIEDQE